MKKMMMIAAMMLMSIGAFAQNEVGQFTLKPTVGLNIASISKFDYSKTRVGMMAGVEGEYGVAENFGLTAGLFYSMQGVKQDWSESESVANVVVSGGAKATYKLDYLNIPILAQYYVIPGLAVKAGIQPGFCVSKKYDAEGNVTIAGQNIFSESEKGKIEDGIKSFQFAIPVGLSYEYQSFVLDARYNIYLTKALKDANGRHSLFTISLGYKFAL